MLSLLCPCSACDVAAELDWSSSPAVYLQDVTVDDAHIKAINSLAARLERQNSDDLDTVKQKRKGLNDR